MTFHLDTRPRTLALAALLGLAALAHAGNWPRFRGPNGAGEADDKNIPVTFSEKENLLWKVALPGVGHSSPVVWGDSLFLQSSSPDGRERWLVCVDTGEGKVRWKTPVAGGRGKTHQRNSLASGTPATDGERVYSVFWDGDKIALYAHDFKGQEVWKRELGTFASQHGAGHSPVVHEGKVILANDQDGSAVLLAFDAKSGEPAWKAKRKPFRACYSTPFLLENGGASAELIVASTSGITSYDPATGAENWDYTWHFTGMALRTVASPVAANGIIFTNSGDGNGARHAIAIKAGRKGADTSKNLLWEEKKTFPYVPCMLTRGDLLFWVNDKGQAACHEAATGKEVWTERLNSPVTASPVLIDGKIYAFAEDGTVFVYAAAKEFKLLGKSSLGEPVSATPAVADGKLFIRGKEHLFCIGKKPTK